jgi:CBS domain containing-hemolysin-like protein
VLSREDFSAMAEVAREEGELEESESKVIRNLLKFDEIKVKDVMTPKAVMLIAPETQSIRAFFAKHPALRFSRIPVYGEREDIITGFVLKDNVLEELIRENGDKPLAEIRRDIVVTRRETPIPQLFDTLIRKREHIALVVDEYGSVSGLVTMEDMIETLLGLEIMDESDNVEDLQQYARSKWEERAKRTGIIE